MINNQRALITGITGQDGAYLAQFLLHKGYTVYGAHRHTSSNNFWRLDELGIHHHPHLHLMEFDLLDFGSTRSLLETTEPHEVYNLAAQSFVGTSFNQPVATAQINGVGALNLLEAIRSVNPKIKFYQASTSEMFGKTQKTPQQENTPFYPRSPYGIAKLFAHWTTVNYREGYNIFAASGILFNHESPLRGLEFITRKITDGVAKIQLKQREFIELGNLNAKRDWGFAKEYVEGMWLMLQAEEPETFVLATNRSETVRDFVRLAFQCIGTTIEFRGKAENEIGYCVKTGQTLVRVNPKFYRPTEVDFLIGNPEKAKLKLGWQARTTLETLCRLMVEADCQRNRHAHTSRSLLAECVS